MRLTLFGTLFSFCTFLPADALSRTKGLERIAQSSIVKGIKTRLKNLDIKLQERIPAYRTHRAFSRQVRSMPKDSLAARQAKNLRGGAKAFAVVSGLATAVGPLAGAALAGATTFAINHDFRQSVRPAAAKHALYNQKRPDRSILSYYNRWLNKEQRRLVRQEKRLEKAASTDGMKSTKLRNFLRGGTPAEEKAWAQGGLKNNRQRQTAVANELKRVQDALGQQQ
jgi:hypothetical protein